ncbi:unnamed protein product [Amoebophrya sp. A25]|nr:unnamed protein product [Amoebophrya sp. A25]|eukprot:GSA25T00004925001.1
MILGVSSSLMLVPVPAIFASRLYRFRPKICNFISCVVVQLALGGGPKAVVAGPASPVKKMSIVDSHLHIWSDEGPYQNGPPPEVAQKIGTAAQFKAHAAAAGVSAALLVQPAPYGSDHTYMEQYASTLGGKNGGDASGGKNASNGAEQDVPGATSVNLFGMYLATGLKPAEGVESTEEEVSTMREMRSRGYRGVRFNPFLFPNGNLESGIALKLFQEAGTQGLAVGVMAFTGLKPHVPALRTLLKAAPDTTLIIDHFGFFRQPATGGVADDVTVDSNAAGASTGEKPKWMTDLATKLLSQTNSQNPNPAIAEAVSKELMTALSPKNDEEAFELLLQLGRDFPEQVFVKLSAFFRVSKLPFPHYDVRPRVLSLLSVLGAKRLMWGSDFPFILPGGHSQTHAAVDYERAVGIFSEWNNVIDVPTSGEQQELPPLLALKISAEDIQSMMGDSARTLLKMPGGNTFSGKKDDL